MTYTVIINVHQTNLELVKNGNINEVIEFAKKYNIFQPSNTKVYKEMCDAIKNRLDSEGLDYEIIRSQ